jgi:hypothetical protein
MQNDPLEIPDFLKRKIKDTPVRKYKPRKIKLKMYKQPFEKRPPKTMKNAKLVALQFAGQCPKIGMGYRHVWAAQGTKWVSLCSINGKRGKLSIAEFNKILVHK